MQNKPMEFIFIFWFPGTPIANNKVEPNMN